jgi:subtilisin family serine protease
MPRAWDITTGSPRVVIADVDTGVDPTMIDLQGAFVPGWDFVGNDPTPEDVMGHGTVTATAMAARGNDGYGIAGYCWRCKVMPVRVSKLGDEFDPNLTAEGIMWAADNGARVISLSFSDEGVYPTGNPQIAGAIAYAAGRGVLIFASAGNTMGSTIVTHPAGDPGAYAVAGTDPLDALYPWSATGSWIHLAMPGCQLADDLQGGFMPWCGTSMAAPALAGIAGLMLSVKPSLTPTQIVSALQSTSVPVNGIAGGRVDAYRALLAIGAKDPTTPPPPPPPPPAAVGALAPPAVPKAPPTMETRVAKGVLAAHRVVRIRIAQGPVTATLRTQKAKACTVSLRSNDQVWVSSSRSRTVVSVAAKLEAGLYKVDVSCSAKRPRPFTLALRADFA